MMKLLLQFSTSVLCAAVLLGGCARATQPYDPNLGHRVDGLPTQVDALLMEADAAARLGPSGPDLNRSLAAANAALVQDPQHGEAAWRAARALYFMTLHESDAAQLTARCMDVSAVAVKNAARAEAHFYAALCMGARAQVRNVEGLDLVTKMVAEGRRALALNESALFAGAHRLLGGIFLRAPAWPTSVGDLDQAIEHLEKAAAIAPSWAENHLLLAEAYLEDDRKDDARESLERARAHLWEPEAEGWRAGWARELDLLFAKLDGD